MTNVNTREIILGILLEVIRDGEYSHIAIRNTLEKYQYLPKQERSFITRICEGTIEQMILLDYIIDQFSNIKVAKMKPVIQNILRSAVYQIKFMDSVPASAACDEAVKLAQKKGFYSLKSFVNGVLRNIVRNLDKIEYPTMNNPTECLSVQYSMPRWLVKKWIEEFGIDITEIMLKDFLKDKPTTIRCKTDRIIQSEILDSLHNQGVTVKRNPYLPYAFNISDYNYLPALDAFIRGWIFPQDISSMLVAEIANPIQGDYVIDMCAAPGGKSLHMADKMGGYGMVEARDLTEYKVDMIWQNIKRADLINVKAVQMDGTIFDGASMDRADIVLADVPCSGLGVIGKKTDIKYKASLQKIDELVELQRKILHNAASYVRPGGTLIYSTCTIGRRENQDNVEWFLENYPFELDSIDPFLCEELHRETTAKGYLQLLPGIYKSDGFFMARLKRKKI